jgi:hypothetical protein
MNLLSSCNTGTLRVEDNAFREVWCKRCSNASCELAEFAKQDKMAHRARTWEQRYFGTPQVDSTHPLHAIINRHDFPDLLHKAVVQEISERRGDWSLPEVGPEALRSPLLLTPPKQDLVIASDPVEVAAEILEESVPPSEGVETSPVVLPKGPVPPVPSLRNVPRSAPRMVGGSSPPEAVVDPWAPAPAKPTVVKTGTKVQFDKDGKLILP